MIGVNGLEEKGINLQIAVKLKDSLEKQGFSVIMTREEDKGLYEEDSRNQKAQDMQCRIAMIKKYRPVLCISVHQNSYQDPHRIESIVQGCLSHRSSILTGVHQLHLRLVG